MKVIILVATLIIMGSVAFPSNAKDMSGLYSTPKLTIHCIDGFNLVTAQIASGIVSYQLKGANGMPSLCGKRLATYKMQRGSLNAAILEANAKRGLTEMKKLEMGQ